MHILCLQSEKCGSESKLERFFLTPLHSYCCSSTFHTQQCKNLRWKFEPQLCEKIWLIWKSQIHVWKCKGLWRFWSLKGVCVCTGAKRMKMSGFDGLSYWLTLLLSLEEAWKKKGRCDCIFNQTDRDQFRDILKNVWFWFLVSYFLFCHVERVVLCSILISFTCPWLFFTCFLLSCLRLCFLAYLACEHLGFSVSFLSYYVSSIQPCVLSVGFGIFASLHVLSFFFFFFFWPALRHLCGLSAIGSFLKLPCVTKCRST